MPLTLVPAEPAPAGSKQG